MRRGGARRRAAAGAMRRETATAAVLLLALSIAAVADAHCPNSCNGHGECVGTAKCSCWSQWTGGDCSMRKCPTGVAWADQATADETAHQPAECSARGLCDHTTGICTCDEGFEGLACNRMTCPNDCSGHGSCRSMKYHAANSERGYAVDNVGHTTYTYTTNWDADKIWGCECDRDFTGYDCSLRVCPAGDDPLTTGQLNEVQYFKCIRDPDTGDSFTLTYKGETTVAIPADASAGYVDGALENLKYLGNVEVTFTSGTTVCNDDGGNPNPVRVEFTKDFGDVAHLLSLDANGEHPPLDLEFAYDGDAIDLQTSVTCTKELEACSNRGFCDTKKGICTCYTGYETSNGEGESGNRGDCGYPSTPITACPGVTSCSGHGVCSGDPEYRCTCDEGWMGGDCREQICPCGASWFDAPTEENNKAHAITAECANKGTCNRETGTCKCHDGFEGEACQRLSCPKDEDGNTCSNHGKCLSMKQLAEYATTNGDATDWTYGFTPNDPQRWDFENVMGCFCDTGFQGYDCSERVCPIGDDVTTEEQNSETVIMECHHLDDSNPGSFKLMFRQETTALLDATATAEDVEAALEALNTIEDVSVTFSRGHEGATACMGDLPYDPNYIRIVFETETGDLPDLTEEAGDINVDVTFWFDGADDSAILDVDFFSLKGTREAEECSERGLCDHTTGQCQCFVGFGSSDHKGGRGGHADCGFRLPIVPTITGFSERTGTLIKDGATGFNPAPHADVGTDLDAFQVIGP